MAEKRAKVAYNHLLLRSRPGMHYLSALCLEDLSEIPLDLPFLNPNLPITASSCDHLLYLDDCKGYVYLCNPTTKQFRSFPIEPALAISGAGSLGYDSNSDDYKIVWFHHHGARVYSLKNDDGWKEIPTPPSPTGKRMFLKGHHNVSLTYCCFWLVWVGIDTFVVSFDFSSEVFSSFPLPPPLYAWLGTDHLLVKLGDGLLGVVCYWRKYGKSIADRGYSYRLYAWKEAEMEWDMMFEATLCDGAGMPLGLVHDRFMILEGMTSVGLPDVSRLLVYDWTTGDRRELPMCDHPARRAFSYVDTAIATALLLPKGNPVDSGRIVNNVNPDDVWESVTLDTSGETYEEDLHNLCPDESEMSEEEKMMNLMHISIYEEFSEQMAVADLSKMDSKIESEVKKEVENGSEANWPLNEDKFLRLMPKSLDEYLKRTASLADYAMTGQASAFFGPHSKESCVVTEDDDPVLREMEKFVAWYNNREQLSKLDEAFLDIQLRGKALELFEDNPPIAVCLHKHLLRTEATPFVDTLLVHLDTDNKLKNGLQLEGSQPEPVRMSSADRISLAKSLPGPLSVKAIQLIETLDGQLVQSFISATTELAEESGLILKKIDEKMESALLHSYANDLMSQVSANQDKK